MPTRYLLDTNICIYIQRQKPDEVLVRFQKLKPGDAAISVITWGELLYGAEKSHQRKRALQLLEEFKTFVPVLPMPENAGKTYGAIRATLESQGKPIGNKSRSFNDSNEQRARVSTSARSEGTELGWQIRFLYYRKRETRSYKRRIKNSLSS